MSDFSGMEELLSDFLLEAGELLSSVDSKLMLLERNPKDHALLNDIFRGFHTIKGGAGFLNAENLVNLCHLTENLFDKLRNKELVLTDKMLDVIFISTGEVGLMFNQLRQKQMPVLSNAIILERLRSEVNPSKVEALCDNKEMLDDRSSHYWEALFDTVCNINNQTELSMERPKESEKVQVTKDQVEKRQELSSSPSFSIEGKETTIRVDIVRLDQVLNLSGEIGLAKNRLTHIRSEILQGKNDPKTLSELDVAVTQLDMLVINLQNAVMKTRMQPIGRLFNKYPRLARDLSRALGKNVELVLAGEETEMDKTMLEDLGDPLVHLVRNAVDHGAESIDERRAANKSEKSMIELSAKQEGDNILIAISDDGKGMDPSVLRKKAIEKGLLSSEAANTLDENQCLELIFMPGFSTKDEISSVSGRGVGMDVVKTNIQKLNGTIHIHSVLGKGSVFTISLPLTLAILPVLILRQGDQGEDSDQSFAVPLSMVREIISLSEGQIQKVSGKSTMVIRGEVLPVRTLSSLIGWCESSKSPEVGVLMQVGNNSFILSADGFAGHDDVVIKSLDTFKPKGVAGVTMSSEGEIVLILDIKELLSDLMGKTPLTQVVSELPATLNGSGLWKRSTKEEAWFTRLRS